VEAGAAGPSDRLGLDEEVPCFVEAPAWWSASANAARWTIRWNVSPLRSTKSVLRSHMQWRVRSHQRQMQLAQPQCRKGRATPVSARHRGVECRPWVASLRRGRAWVLSVAGYNLRSTGAASERLRADGGGARHRDGRADWGSAALSALRLSELHLTLGEIALAIAYASGSTDLSAECETFSGSSSAQRWPMRSTRRRLTKQGTSSSRRGDSEDGAPFHCFTRSRLYYCDLLLTVAPLMTFFVEHSRRWLSRADRWLLDAALDHLSSVALTSPRFALATLPAEALPVNTRSGRPRPDQRDKSIICPGAPRARRILSLLPGPCPCPGRLDKALAIATRG